MSSKPLIHRLLLMVMVTLTTKSVGADLESGSIKEIERLLDELIGEAAREALAKSDEEADNDDGCTEEALKPIVEWTEHLDKQFGELQHNVSIATWNYATNLTEYNAQKLSVAQAAVDDWFVDRLPTGRRYLRQLSDCTATGRTTVARRLLERFVYTKVVPVADRDATRKKINHLVASLEEIYSTASVTDDHGDIYRLEPELTNLMVESRDYDRLAWAWEAWRNATGPRMKSKYVQLVEAMNEAAWDNGFADVGVAWQMADFDMADVEVKIDRLFAEIRPFYRHLHAYVRRRLIDAYPGRNIDPRGPIPAHLFGDMWAQ
jgi:hypothetical protein